MLHKRITLLGVGAASAVLGLAFIGAPVNQAIADHNLVDFGVLNAPTATTTNSGGEGASWEVITSLTSGNPHTDLDFFTSGGDLYLAAGTLAIGPNAGGQVIHRLTSKGEIDPGFVSALPTASCITDPSQATALQHDVEVTPKGHVLLNTDWQGLADTRDAQLLLDATDGPGRCHDQGPNAAAGAAVGGQAPGGLEIIDITNITAPVEIHLTSHIGEAHTVNVDPKRSHIAYAVTSDTVTLANRPDVDDTTRSEQFDLDGFELVDLSSCMNFPVGTDLATRREQCRPQVYRYRLDPDWARGTYDSGTAGACHELELYPDDRLSCASLNASIILDMSGAFDDNGTPDDYTDDIPRGTPLPCSVRESTSNEENLFPTAAMVTDCVNGLEGQSLSMGGWLEIGAPSLEGVELVGFINHNGRTLSNSAADSRPPAIDVAVSHEAELTHSGRFLMVTDERGGGIVPPDATCPTPGTNAGNEIGNGGIHAYAVDRLFKSYPGDPAVDDPEAIASAADAAYALTPAGDKAVFRATPRVAGNTFCTSHVMHQIPGQNRIFMGWYTQGTQVVDYIEHDDGSFEWIEAAWWVPENAGTWTSHVFAFHENSDGSYTYFGATSDFGRTAVDIYSVILPAPPQMKASTPVNVPVRTQPLGGSRGGASGLGLFLLASLALALRGRRWR